MKNINRIRCSGFEKLLMKNNKKTIKQKYKNFEKILDIRLYIANLINHILLYIYIYIYIYIDGYNSVIQQLRVGVYIIKQKILGRSKYPLVLMLEPIFRCNLACRVW